MLGDSCFDVVVSFVSSRPLLIARFLLRPTDPLAHFSAGLPLLSAFTNQRMGTKGS